MRAAQDAARQGQLIAEAAAARLAAEDAARREAERQMARVTEELRRLESQKSVAIVPVPPAEPEVAKPTEDAARLETENSARQAAEERMARLTEEARVLEKKLEDARKELEAALSNARTESPAP